MKLETGLVFEIYYNENNPNNIYRCEVRAVVDDEVIVLLCETKKSYLREGRIFYKMIDMYDWEFNVNNGIYRELK